MLCTSSRAGQENVFTPSSSLSERELGKSWDTILGITLEKENRCLAR